MYSLVLMMALSGSAEAPTFGKGCNGCNGCWASSCNGCCGGYSCHGCHGCCGGRGFLGGLFGKNKGCHGCNGCHGYSCHGCSGCHGAVYTGCCGGTVVAPAAPAEPKKEMKEPAKEEKKEGAAAAAPATLVVSLPADAKLTIDESATQATAAVRTFVTPTLEAGKDFSYSLKAEVVRNGQTLTATQNVTVRAGQVSRITLEIPAPAGVAAR
jgi:uncharacterized protein (TIGR03000 family)